MGDPVWSPVASPNQKILALCVSASYCEQARVEPCRDTVQSEPPPKIHTYYTCRLRLNTQSLRDMLTHDFIGGV